MDEGWVYYAKMCCRIKIGFVASSDDLLYPPPLLWKMRQLGAELEATEWGTSETERMRHRQFAADRVVFDWFEYSPAIRAHIVGLRVRHHTTDTDNPGERMIPTASAVAYTGRERQVLYRWAREGRITRYGTEREALWDILQLPRKDKDPIPPRRKS